MISAILIGAGARGMDAYGAYALRHPEKLKFVAVAEPNEARRSAMAAAHHIPPDRCFDDWKPLWRWGKLQTAAWFAPRIASMWSRLRRR